LAGNLFASHRSWSSLGRNPEAFIYIPLYGIRWHLLEMFIGRQNWSLSRTGKAGKNNCQTYG
jgi:hypothetical protein